MKPLLNVIYPHLVGKTIRDVGRDGRYLYIQTEQVVPGHGPIHELYRFEWLDDSGTAVRGYPQLVERKDARVMVVGAGGRGKGHA